LQPLSKEGTFIETRLTTRNTATSLHHFEDSKKKFPKTLRDEKFEVPLRPLSREVLYRMRREEIVERFSSETFEESFKQQYICHRFL